MTSLLYYLSAHIRRIFDADTSPAPRPRLLFRDDRALRRFVRRGDGRPEELRAAAGRPRRRGALSPPLFRRVPGGRDPSTAARGRARAPHPARSPRGRVSGGTHDADGARPSRARDGAFAGGLELQAYL